jgi:hypothetical protein
MLAPLIPGGDEELAGVLACAVAAGIEFSL